MKDLSDCLDANPLKKIKTIGSMYGMFTYMELMFVGNVGKYTIQPKQVV